MYVYISGVSISYFLNRYIGLSVYAGFMEVAFVCEVGVCVLARVCMCACMCASVGVYVS